MKIDTGRLIRYINDKGKHIKENLEKTKRLRHTEATKFNNAQYLLWKEIKEEIGGIMEKTWFDYIKKWIPFSIVVILMWSTPYLTWKIYHFIAARLTEYRLVPLLNKAGIVCGLLYFLALCVKAGDVWRLRFWRVVIVSAILLSTLAMLSSRLVPGEKVHIVIFVTFGFWLFALTANRTDWFLRFMHTTLLMFAVIAIKEFIESRMLVRVGDPFDLGIDMQAVVVGLLLRDFWESLGR